MPVLDTAHHDVVHAADPSGTILRRSSPVSFHDRFHSSSSRSPGPDFDTGENNASQISIPTLSIPLPSFDL